MPEAATRRLLDVGAVSVMTATGLYVVLFLCVAASWAGVPAIGTTAAAAAGVAASQGKLSLPLVVAVTTVAGEVGGLVGYWIGLRWGRELFAKPGRHLDSRQRVLARGEVAYQRYGRLAVFFTPAIVSGTAKMQHRQFALWNFLAALAFAVAVCASSYGLGRVATGHSTARDVSALVVGLLAAAALVVVFRRRLRSRKVVVVQ